MRRVRRMGRGGKGEPGKGIRRVVGFKGEGGG